MIETHVAPHPFFEPVGQDIRLILPVTLSEAVLGAAIEVRTPKGKVSMRIPAGSDSGTELRLVEGNAGRSAPLHGGQFMITFDVLIARTAGLRPVDLNRRISNNWVRPD